MQKNFYIFTWYIPNNYYYGGFLDKLMPLTVVSQDVEEARLLAFYKIVRFEFSGTKAKKRALEIIDQQPEIVKFI